MTVELDNVVIHIDDWDAYNAFYADVLAAELVENPEAAGNPPSDPALVVIDRSSEASLDDWLAELEGDEPSALRSLPPSVHLDAPLVATDQRLAAAPALRIETVTP